MCTLSHCSVTIAHSMHALALVVTLGKKHILAHILWLWSSFWMGFESKWAAYNTAPTYKKHFICALVSFFLLDVIGFVNCISACSDSMIYSDVDQCFNHFINVFHCGYKILKKFLQIYKKKQKNEMSFTNCRFEHNKVSNHTFIFLHSFDAKFTALIFLMVFFFSQSNEIMIVLEFWHVLHILRTQGFLSDLKEIILNGKNVGDQFITIYHTLILLKCFFL